MATGRRYLVGGVLVGLVALVVGALLTRSGKSPAQALLNNRYHMQVETSLASAAIAQESFFTQDPHTYTDDVAQLVRRGLQVEGEVSIVVLSANKSSYCIQATHERLPATHPFKVATYDSKVGRPVAEDHCGE